LLVRARYIVVVSAAKKGYAMQDDQLTQRSRRRPRTILWALLVAAARTPPVVRVQLAEAKGKKRSASRCEVGEITVDRDWTSGFGDPEKLVKSKSLPKYYAQSARPNMCKQPGDRDPVEVTARRAEALLADIAWRPGAPDLADERAELKRLIAADVQIADVRFSRGFRIRENDIGHSASLAKASA
jgi:hypothetical protein